MAEKNEKTLEIMAGDALRIIGGVGRFSAYFVPEFVEHIFTPFVLPTWHRRVKEKSKNKEKHPNVVIYQNAYAFIFSAKEYYKDWRISEAIGVSTIWLFLFAEQIKDHPKYLLVPLVTNAVSGLYEWGRNAYKRTKKK